MARIAGKTIRGKDDAWLESFFTKLGIVRRRKLAIAHACQKGRCIYCERELRLSSDPPDGRTPLATLEHLVPQSKGGTDAQSNLAAACQQCNVARGADFSVEDFRKLRADPKRWAEYVAERRKLKAQKENSPRIASILRLASLFLLIPSMMPIIERAIDEAQKEQQARKVRPESFQAIFKIQNAA
jgi:5-methylcytosine-specific restriction endonuclease McrA